MRSIVVEKTDRFTACRRMLISLFFGMLIAGEVVDNGRLMQMTACCLSIER